VSGAVRVGFAGAGHIANVHAGILADDPRVRVAAIYDPDEQPAAAFALKTGATVARSLEELLSAVDALYICSPNARHAGTALAALAAGLHVFSEKPMATSLADAQAVLAAAERSHAAYQVGFNRRFAGVYKELKRLIEAGDICPTSALMKMNRGELQSPAWTGDVGASGGFLYETPIHMLDMARFLFGEPADVICRARATVYDQADDFSMLLTFASGMSAVLAASAHTTWLFPFERVEVYGDHAIAATEEMERITFGTGVAGTARTTDFAQQPFAVRWGYVEEDRRFVDGVCEAGEVAVSAAEALRTIELVDTCYRAASV
jgi:myo-inositol 2-dehydrogenase/D-chiro-inositol 1-dehydrogenase